MQTDWAAFEINGAQHIIHRRPTPTTFVLPWSLGLKDLLEGE
jgi:hypothetical protein